MVRRGTSRTPPRRRWLRYGIVIGLLLLIVVVYETGQQLRHRGQETDQAVAPDARESPQRLKSYYRSHDLPAGWEVGEIARNDAGTVEVPLYFAPGIRSSRYGQAARPGEIGPHNACPTREAGLWKALAERAFRIVVNDKTGIIDQVECLMIEPGE